MIRLPEIWACIKYKMPRGEWVDIEDIYGLIEKTTPQIKKIMNGNHRRQVFQSGREMCEMFFNIEKTKAKQSGMSKEVIGFL